MQGNFGTIQIQGSNPASLNPDTLPRPVSAEAGTDISKVLVAGIIIPLLFDLFLVQLQPASRLEQVNCHPNFVRLTTNYLPNSAQVRNMWKLPIGIANSPML